MVQIFGDLLKEPDGQHLLTLEAEHAEVSHATHPESPYGAALVRVALIAVFANKCDSLGEDCIQMRGCRPNLRGGGVCVSYVAIVVNDEAGVVQRIDEIDE